MHFPRLALALLCLLLASGPHLTGQSVVLPPSITFTGTSAYTQADLLVFTALKPGSISSTEQIQSAAQRLSDTGLFAEVRFQSNPAGLSFNLEPMDPSALVPARFTNFLFFSPDELIAALKARVPLFLGAVPVKGDLEDKLIAALITVLAQRGIKAQVVAMPEGPADSPPTDIAFTIGTPEVLVHAVTLDHVNPILDSILKNLAGKPYDELTTPRTIATQLADACRNQGYLDVAVNHLDHTAPQITPTAITIDYTVAFTEGEPYRLSALTWAGSPVFSQADLAKSTKIHPGDIASQQALRDTLRTLANAYYARGFQDAKIQAPPIIDRTAHRVAYTVTVIPGDQYRLRNLKINGLTPDQQHDFDAIWRMPPGSFYDVNSMNSFLLTPTLPTSLKGLSANYRALSDPNTHLVDLTITFIKGGNLVEVK